MKTKVKLYIALFLLIIVVSIIYYLVIGLERGVHQYNWEERDSRWMCQKGCVDYYNDIRSNIREEFDDEFRSCVDSCDIYNPETEEETAFKGK